MTGPVPWEIETFLTRPDPTRDISNNSWPDPRVGVIFHEQPCVFSVETKGKTRTRSRGTATYARLLRVALWHTATGNQRPFHGPEEAPYPGRPARCAGEAVIPQGEEAVFFGGGGALFLLLQYVFLPRFLGIQPLELM